MCAATVPRMTDTSGDGRRLPPALAELARTPIDHAEGIDFEPYDAFCTTEETTAWVREWTGDPEADGSALRIFGQDGSGGLAALWRARPGRPLTEQPVVFLGSEGECGIVAKQPVRLPVAARRRHRPLGGRRPRRGHPTLRGAPGSGRPSRHHTAPRTPPDQGGGPRGVPGLPVLRRRPAPLTSLAPSARTTHLTRTRRQAAYTVRPPVACSCRQSRHRPGSGARKTRSQPSQSCKGCGRWAPAVGGGGSGAAGSGGGSSSRRR